MNGNTVVYDSIGNHRCDVSKRFTTVVTMRQPAADGTADVTVSVWDSRGAPADYTTGSLLFDMGWRENAVDDPVVAAPGDVERLRSSVTSS